MIINQWVSKVHTTAKSKGWWEKPRDELEICQLFVTEIAEASECARNGEPVVHFGHVAADSSTAKDLKDIGIAVAESNKKLYALEGNVCTGYKPEGEAIELIDLLIRLGDYFGHKEWNLGEAVASLIPELADAEATTFEDVVMHATKVMGPEDYSDRPLVNHFELVSLIVTATESAEKTQATKYAQVFLTTIGYMVYRGMYVEAAMEIKAAYNEKRPYRHGGKLA
jgi:hypothetical protein